MIQSIPKQVTFEEFILWYPDGKGRYELHNGIIIEMNPTGNNEEVTAFLNRKLNVEIERLNLLYLIPRTYFVKPSSANNSY